MANPRVLEQLRRHLRGQVIAPEDPDYDDARRVYNRMIDRRPGAVVRCATAGDVAAALAIGEDAGLAVAVRCGGHNAGGLGVCDDGIVIDLAPMRDLSVDPEARTARVGGGCTWGEVDRATHPYGFAVPSGIISTTGVGGLTLGGGTGHLTRRFGLTIDNLLAADVVLADGTIVHASEDDHADLFWALRGGGGNFGVVTAFHFQLQPVDDVLAGPSLWPLDRTREVLSWYREFILAAPEDLSGFFAVMTVPPAPPFPQALHLKKMCAVVWCWTGAPERAGEVFADVLAMQPLLHGVQPMPFPMLQMVFDPLYPPGLQWYWKADFIREIPDEAVAEHARLAAELPTPLSTMHLYPMDGAVHRVSEDATAFGFREANWNQVIVGVDPEAANRAKIIDWTRRYWNAIHPYSAGGAYVNFLMGDEGGDRVRATYRGNYARLVEVKRRYDPHNRFHINQNIDPGVAAAVAEAEARPPT
ncbi:MAG: FAD-binding oxidoreductase [Deltaproteobacteria bacterium]|nr:FAD-binding oxidoreductase [Deltaproteobacteria bacterium]